MSPCPVRVRRRHLKHSITERHPGLLCNIHCPLPACYSLRINKSKATANTTVAVIQKTLARIGTETRMNSALNAQRRVPTVSARPQRAVKVTAMKQPSTQRVKRAFAKEHQSPIDSVVMYISEAFSQIFRTTESQVPWSQTSFSGRILHHENAGTRNRSMNPYQKKNVVAQAIPVQVDEQANGGATNFVVDSIGRIMGGRVDESSGEPKRFYSTGYTGKKYGSRRVKREVDRVWRY